MLHRGPGFNPGSICGCRPCCFQTGDAVIPAQRGGGVLETTIRMRLVHEAVEITEVVARMGDGPLKGCDEKAIQGRRGRPPEFVFRRRPGVKVNAALGRRP